MLLPRIKELRKSRNLTQSQVADALGVSRPAYSNWENGTFGIDTENLIKLAKFHKVTLDYLVGLTDDKYSQQVQKLFDRLSPSDQELVLKVTDRFPKKK